jgi:ATP-dependent helicase/nuclease subunit A
MNKTIPDAAARTQALDVRRSFLVQAPAGSGKTELLIQRFLALLACVEQPEAIVAITFTRKAAGEMRDRVLRSLEQAEAGEPAKEAHEKITRQLARAVLAHDAERQWNLRRMPARLRIQTIDSLCAAIVRGVPGLSGFGGALEVTESPEDLYAAAAHQTVLLLSAGSPRESQAVAALLRHLDNDVRKVEALIAAMLKQRDQWMRHFGSGMSTENLRETLDEVLERIIADCLQRLRAEVPVASAQELVELAAFAAAQAQNADRPIRYCAGMVSLPATNAGERGKWEGIADLLLTTGSEWRRPNGINANLGFPAGFAERRRIQNLLRSFSGNEPLLAALRELRELPPSQISDQQWPVIEALFCLLPRAVQELKRLFAEAGQVDFSEVAQAASRGLGPSEAPTDLALALEGRIEHLLVDEYQDTSVSQQELLEKLVAGWEPGDGRTLFLVGDPMQSIYRFRQAEVGLFINAAKTSRFGEIELVRLTLTKNFRSQQGIVSWVNDVFQKVFPPEDDIGKSAVAYTEAVAVKPAAAIESVQVHPFVERDDYPDAEGERVINLIEAALERDPKGKVAVLVRARTHLAALLPKLRQRAAVDPRFRFQAVEIDSLAERQIVLDLLALTRALLHLADRIAWLSVLRAPWCGLTLKDLHQLCAADGRSCVWDLLRRRLSELSADGQQRVARLCEVFAPALKNRGRQPLAQLVRGLWLSLGGPASCDAGEIEDANTFFELLDEFDRSGDLGGPRQLDARLRDLFANPDPGAEGKLQLMTVHKAKGLEFDTVIMPGLGRRPKREDPRLLLWMERATAAGGSELLLAPITQKGDGEDGLSQFIQRIERQRGAEEGKRLLYVGATRARTQLHLLGHASADQNGELKPQSGSLLQYLWPVVEAQFRQTQASQVAQGIQLAAAAAPPRPELKRLPVSWTLPAMPPRLSGAERLAAAGPDISFDWASDIVRHVGTVTHALLHKIAREGLDNWDVSTVKSHREAIRSALLQCGVSAAELERAADRVQTGLRQTLSDPRGRWVLGRHNEAQSEYAISGQVNGQLRHFKLDRTFVDDAGVRWIIDFKTGEREGAGRDEFADAEVLRYREQLENYACVLVSVDPRPVRMGLYFPLLGAWREWPLPGCST